MDLYVIKEMYNGWDDSGCRNFFITNELNDFHLASTKTEAKKLLQQLMNKFSKDYKAKWNDNETSFLCYEESEEDDQLLNLWLSCDYDDTLDYLENSETLIPYWVVSLDYKAKTLNQLSSEINSVGLKF